MENCIPVCDCEFGMSNTGVDCSPLIAEPRLLFLMPKYKADGTRNYISLTTPITASTFSAIINQADASLRFYPLPELKDVTTETGDPVKQTFDDDTMIHIRNGIRNFSGTIWGRNGNNVLQGKLEAARCGEMMVYIGTRTGSLVGIPDAALEKFYGLDFDSQSLSVTNVWATSKTQQGLKIDFNFSLNHSDACIKQILKSDMDNVDLFALRGLLDINAEFSAISTGGFTMKLTTDFGTAMGGNAITGVLVSEVAAYNVTQSSAIAITGTGAAFVESVLNPGTYAVEYATADDTTAADVVRITITKTGYGVLVDTFNTP